MLNSGRSSYSVRNRNTSFQSPSSIEPAQPGSYSTTLSGRTVPVIQKRYATNPFLSVCCWCPMLAKDKFHKRTQLIRHRISHYDHMYKSIPYVLLIIYFVIEVPLFLKNIIYYSTVGEIGIGYAIFDPIISLLGLVFGFILYSITKCSIVILKKRKSPAMTALTGLLITANIFSIFIRSGFQNMIAKKAYPFTPLDTHQTISLTEYSLSFFLIPPIWYPILLVCAILGGSIGSINSEITYEDIVRWICVLLVIAFIKYNEEKENEREFRYIRKNEKLQESVFKEKEFCLSILRTIIPMRLLAKLQHTQNGSILLKSVVIIQINITHDRFFNPHPKHHLEEESEETEGEDDEDVPSDDGTNDNRTKINELYDRYIRISDIFDKIASRANMLRLKDVKQKLVYVSWSDQETEERDEEVNVIDSCSCAIEMREVYINNICKSKDTFNMKFFVCRGPLSLGVDMLNENSKLRFLHSSFILTRALNELSEHPNTETGQIYTIRMMLEKAVMTSENTPKTYFGMTHLRWNVNIFPGVDMPCEISQIKVLRRPDLLDKNLMKIKQQESGCGDDDDDGSENSVDFLRVFEDKKEKKNQHLNNDQDGTLLATKNKKNKCLRCILPFQQPRFKNKKVEKKFNEWNNLRTYSSYRVISSMFLGIVIKAIVTIGLIISDHYGETCLTNYFHTLVLSLQIYIFARITHRNSRKCKKCFVAYLTLELLYTLLWVLGHFSPTKITHQQVNSHKFLLGEQTGFFDTQYYCQGILIFQMYPNIPLCWMVIFSIANWVIWVFAKYDFYFFNDNDEGFQITFLIFHMMKSSMAVLILFVAYYQSFARTMASRSIFKFSFKVHRLARFLMNNRTFNKIVIENSVPVQHKLRRYLGHDSILNAPFYFGRCNIMVIKFEWSESLFSSEAAATRGIDDINEEIYDTRDLLWLKKVAHLNECLEKRIDEMKSRDGLERLFFNETECLIIQYNGSNILNFIRLACNIREEITLIPDVHARIAIIEDNDPAFGSFGKGRNFVDIFSSSVSVLNRYLRHLGQKSESRNLILVLSEERDMNKQNSIGNRFHCTNDGCFSYHADNVFVVLDIWKEKEKERKEKKKTMVMMNQKLGSSASRKRHINLKIFQFLPRN